MQPLPSGTVTLLFTDIEGSTPLLQKLGEHYARVLSAHHEIARACFEINRGRIVDTQGDSFFVAFPRALDAVNAAMQAQHALADYAWGDDVRVRVRMGLHTGEPIAQSERYVGIDVHRASRICGAGHGGQILISETTYALIKNELPPDISIRDLGAHRLKDFSAPEHLYQIVGADLPSDFPPLGTLDARPNNLPIHLSSFVGRERELAELARHLHSTRLLTLIGAGGAGKTRLSIQLAETSLDAFPDGVWFIELARLRDPAFIPRSIASTLGIRDESGDLAQTLENFLRQKTMLLVLDNCEHVVDSAAQQVEIFLRAAPKLKILATSREALNIAGEQIFHVPSLPLPDTKPSLTPDALAQSDAARLFIERALAANNHFRVTEQNALSIAQICRRLDGIPLALELAAARVSALSVEQIAARLDDVFRLLTGGSRTAMRRQQTLAAAMDWSYNLLSQSERILLQRLSVFAGGWTLEAAEEICAGEEIQSFDVIDLLTRLVNKSLAIAEDANGTTRYRFLETVRQFARYRLFDAEAVETVSDRHLDFFVAFAERARQELHRPNQIEWLKRLDAEQDNLRTALTWALSENPARAAQALRLTGALWMYWDVRGFFQESLQWCERALAASGEENSARAQTLLGAADAISRLGNPEQTITFCQQTLVLARKIGDRHGEAEAMLYLGYMSLYLGDTARADEMSRQAFELYRALGDKDDLGRAQGPFAQRALMQGNYARAAELFETSLTLFRQAGDVREIAGALNNLASVVQVRGDWINARAYARESLELYTALADKHGIATSQRELGRVALARGDWMQAHDCLQTSSALFDEMGDKGCLVESELEYALLAFHENQIALAAQLAERVVASARALGWGQGIPSAKNILARAMLTQGDVERAQEYLNEAFANEQTAPIAISLIETAALIANARRDFGRATKLASAAQAQRERIGVRRPPTQDAPFQSLNQALQAHLGGERFTALWTQGHMVVLEEAIKLAQVNTQFEPTA